MDSFTPNRRWYQVVAATVVALMLAAPLAAQSLTPGSRVRVRTTAFPNEWLNGTVSRQTSEALWLGDRPLALESITRLEVADGKKSQLGKGLRIGALAGGGLGLAIALAAASEDDGSFGGGLGVGVAVMFAPVFAVVGAATGGFVGSLSRTDRWRPIPTDRVRLSVTPTSRGGLGVGVGVSF